MLLCLLYRLQKGYLNIVYSSTTVHINVTKLQKCLIRSKKVLQLIDTKQDFQCEVKIFTGEYVQIKI